VELVVEPRRLRERRPRRIGGCQTLLGDDVARFLACYGKREDWIAAKGEPLAVLAGPDGEPEALRADPGSLDSY
jgi:hypothetical protein